MTDASKVLDDAKYSGTKEVDESLQIDAAKLQPWIDAYIPNAGKITAIEQFKGGQSNPTYKIITDKKRPMITLTLLLLKVLVFIMITPEKINIKMK